MKKAISIFILALALVPLASLSARAASGIPGQPLSLSAAEKQNIERFLDHFNWQGVNEYKGGGDPLAAFWDLAIHKPELVQKNSDGKLGIAEELVEANALKLFGFTLNKGRLPEYAELRDGNLWFPQVDGPTSGTSKIDRAYKSARGEIAVLGVTSLDEEKQPFLAILRSNPDNKEEGLSLLSQIRRQ